MSKAMQFKARIKNLALKNHVSAQSVLQNYMLERLLERISVSALKDRFVLKGGMLIASLVGIDSRTTMDMDATMLQRWRLYYQENYYARGIEFGEIIAVLNNLLK